VKAQVFFNQTIGELVDTGQRWAGAIDPATGKAVPGMETDVSDFDEFLIDAADNGALRWPEGSQWESASDAILRLGMSAAPGVMEGARKHTLGVVQNILLQRPFAGFAGWFAPVLPPL